ncbi:hypothetical protein OSTOST_12481 [Ostertagia ostertagi]
MPRTSGPSTSIRSLIENGTVRLMPPVKEQVKMELHEDCLGDMSIDEFMKAQQLDARRGVSTQNGRSVECNKVRVCDNGLEYRNTLSGSSADGIGVTIDSQSSHPPHEVRRINTRGGVIARSLACLAKYRATNQETVKAPLSQGNCASNQESVKAPLSQVKPPPADEVSNNSTVKEVKKETVELPSQSSEMKEHIVPLF